MEKRTGGSSIAPHTEYARTHGRCPGCGNTVPRASLTEGLCVSCRDGGV